MQTALKHTPISSNPYKFDHSFRLKILALMLDDYWMASVGDLIIKPEYFEDDDEEHVAQAILDYRAAYHKCPDDAVDINVISGGEYAELVNCIFENIGSWDLDLAKDIVVRFAREQAVKLAILDSIDDVNKGDLSAPVEKVRAALQVGENISSPGIDPVIDTDQWLYDYWVDKVRTGWYYVDQCLEGGLGPGELGVILAPQNHGKSMALVNIGFGAATVGSGKNVIHFTHEMSAKQVAKRYAARLTFRFAKPGDDLDTYAEGMQAIARRMLPGRIRVIGGRKSVYDIEAHIEQLIAEGFNPGVIIIDYADLLEPPKQYTDRRYELSAIYQYLRNLAIRFQIPIWTASQSNRDSHSKELITMADIAEDIGKVSIADVIISLCQTYEELQNSLCRLFMAKVRDGRSGQLIAGKFFVLSQAIVSTGFAVVKEKRKSNKDDA